MLPLKISTIFLILAGWSRPILLFSLEMRAMPKRSLCQQSVDTGVPPELLHNTHTNTNTNTNTNSLCQQSIDTVLPSELLLFRRFFSNQSLIPTSCCGRVTDTKIVTFKCLLWSLGAIPTHILSWFLIADGYNVLEPWQIIMTREIGPSTPCPFFFLTHWTSLTGHQGGISLFCTCFRNFEALIHSTNGRKARENSFFASSPVLWSCSRKS